MAACMHLRTSFLCMYIAMHHLYSYTTYMHAWSNCSNTIDYKIIAHTEHPEVAIGS